MAAVTLYRAIAVLMTFAICWLQSVDAAITLTLSKRQTDESSLISRLTTSSFSAGQRRANQLVGTRNRGSGERRVDKSEYQKRDSSDVTSLPPQFLCGFETGGGACTTSVTPVSTGSSASTINTGASSGSSFTTVSTGAVTISGTTSLWTSTITGVSQTGASGTTVSAPGTTQSAVSFSAMNNGIAYTLNVTVAGTVVSLDIDTGSGTFWVAASDCSTCTSYGMKEANLQAGTCDGASQTYGTGQVNGCLVNNTVQIGSYTLSNYGLLAANKIDVDLGMDSSYMSGIWGTGMDSLAISDYPTPVSALYKAGQISAPVIGFYLSRDSDSEDSQITIGDQGTNFHADTSSAVTLTNVNPSQGYYQVELAGLVVGSQVLISSMNQNVILDSGTTNIILPFELLYEIYGQILGGTQVYSTYDVVNGTQYLLPCTQPSNVETFSFMFGSTSFPVEYSDLLGPPVVGAESFCYGRLYNISSISYWILGDAFLHNVYHSVNVQTGDVTLYNLT